MGKSKFSSKRLELKRTLVVSGLALASFVTCGVVRAGEANLDSGASGDLPGNKLETDYPNEGEIKTQEIIAGVERGGFGQVLDVADEVLDPVNPWGPNGDAVNPDDSYPPAIFVPPYGWVPRYYYYLYNGKYYFYYPGHNGTHIGHWHGGS